MKDERRLGAEISTERGRCRPCALMAYVEAPRAADDRAKPSAGPSGTTTAPTDPRPLSPSGPSGAPAR